MTRRDLFIWTVTIKAYVSVSPTLLATDVMNVDLHITESTLVGTESLSRNILQSDKCLRVFPFMLMIYFCRWIFSGNGCQPCTCNQYYSQNTSCQDSGQCYCKVGVGGTNCDACGDGYAFLKHWNHNPSFPKLPTIHRCLHYASCQCKLPLS